MVVGATRGHPAPTLSAGKGPGSFNLNALQGDSWVCVYPELLGKGNPRQGISSSDQPTQHKSWSAVGWEIPPPTPWNPSLQNTAETCFQAATLRQWEWNEIFLPLLWQFSVEQMISYYSTPVKSPFLFAKQLLIQRKPPLARFLILLVSRSFFSARWGWLKNCVWKSRCVNYHQK